LLRLYQSWKLNPNNINCIKGTSIES